jgi:hypothetical protein
MKSFLLSILILGISILSACSAEQPKNTAPTPRPTPSDKYTAADVAKLKWLEGTWRETAGGKTIYGRYHFVGTTLLVETMADDSLSKVMDTSRFELKDGRFGKKEGDDISVAASEITDTYVQFVPVSGVGNGFRFELLPDGTWNAILQSAIAGNAPASSQTYHMERWPPADK